MKIFTAWFSNTINWAVDVDDPSTWESSLLPIFSLLNPLSYSHLRNSLKHQNRPLFIFEKVGVINEKAFIRTNVACFIAHSNDLDQVLTAKDIDAIESFEGSGILEKVKYSDIYYSFFSALMKRVRQVSRQVDAPASITSIGIDEIDEIPFSDFPKIIGENTVYLPRFSFETAISLKHFRQAELTFLKRDFPVFESLLIDSIEACKSQDFRRCLLYAAMSIETIAATTIDRVYDLHLQKKDKSTRFRFVSLNQKGGELITKDPVFEFLRARASFLNLLHELPLYIFDRSLLLEEQSLYQKASKLYSTRNKIAHLGEPKTEKEKYYSMTERDALEVLETAASIFKWFEFEKDFALPRFGVVSGSSFQED